MEELTTTLVAAVPPNVTVKPEAVGKLVPVTVMVVPPVVGPDVGITPEIVGGGAEVLLPLPLEELPKRTPSPVPPQPDKRQVNTSIVTKAKTRVRGQGSFIFASRAIFPKKNAVFLS